VLVPPSGVGLSLVTVMSLFCLGGALPQQLWTLPIVENRIIIASSVTIYSTELMMESCMFIVKEGRT